MRATSAYRVVAYSRFIKLQLHAEESIIDDAVNLSLCLSVCPSTYMFHVHSPEGDTVRRDA